MLRSIETSQENNKNSKREWNDYTDKILNSEKGMMT